MVPIHNSDDLFQKDIESIQKYLKNIGISDSDKFEMIDRIINNPKLTRTQRAELIRAAGRPFNVLCIRLLNDSRTIMKRKKE